MNDDISCRYLNTTYIKKQKYTDADLSYGGISTDTADQLLEIGEVCVQVKDRDMKVKVAWVYEK